jgi:hypothetical protein
MGLYSCWQANDKSKFVRECAQMGRLSGERLDAGFYSKERKA